MYRPLDAFLLRAPLLPEAALGRGARALTSHPLGARALAIASPSLAAALPGARRDRAVARYARRAAFRATPSGLLAGVCVGALAPRSAIATATPEVYLAPSWASVHEAARALLDDPDLRAKTRLRVSPSALRGVDVVRWIGPGEPFGEQRTAEVDERLSRVLESAARWTPWTDLSARLDGDEAGGGGADELLLMLVDEGLLQSDLDPPLVGPPPHVYLEHRLATIGMARPTPAANRPYAVLLHRSARPPTLERAAVERAARLVPTLLALNEALAPPAAERFAQPGISDALDAVTDTFGAGAFELGALATGDYGVDPDDEDAAAPQPMASAQAIAAIVNAIAHALLGGRSEAALDPAALAELPSPPPPPTAELFLAPVPRRAGTAPGTGWLLGLHAPAGASFGRFAHALGAPLSAALSALDAAERRARPDAEVVDVAFSPSAALADLVAHPPVRRRTLALSSWTEHDDLAPGDLAVVADPGDPEALALRVQDGRSPIVPSPLARVRSATAPAGLYRLLAGWSLQKQHATWALPLGPLVSLPFVPRLTLDGFVVSPASWRLPPSRTPAALRRWRRDHAVPRHVQVGDGDELLPVDLDSRDAADDLTQHDRVIEIWPPRGALVDRGGRRVEAVVMLVADSDPVHARADRLARTAGAIPPPRVVASADGWRSFRLYGAARQQDALLVETITPAIAAARTAGEIDRWFFLPYVDGPGRRPHLRLRVHAAGDPHPFEHRLREALSRARARGEITGVEIGDYHPELGRFAPAELDPVHALFEADSELAATLRADDDVDRLTGFVCAADALASGFGLDPTKRHDLAHERRHAAERSLAPDSDDRREADELFRATSRELRAALSVAPLPVFAGHVARVATAVPSLAPDAAARLLPTLLHLCAVRLLGPDPTGERLGYTLWERTLLGLQRR